MKNLAFQLSSGILELDIESEVKPFEDLVGIAERINPKRPFIFVSKVIGRYVPTSLQEMFRISSLLASQVPETLLDGNVTVLSLSETALGLGALVHRHFKTSIGKPIVNAFTSRHLFATPIYTSFQETHSHLPNHYVYRSFKKSVNNHFDNTETLVLVDDEITTGNTLNNLFKSLKLTSVKRVILLSLTDWSGGAIFDWEGIEVHRFSLITGKYKWTQTSDEVVQLPYNPSTIDESENLINISPNSTRLPSFEGLKIKDQELEDKNKPISVFDTENKPVVCLYYNEMLPQAIETMHYLHDFTRDVYFLSLSSSPIELGFDIQSKIELPGYYSDIPVYLYNFQEFATALDNPSVTLIYEPDRSAKNQNKDFKNPLQQLIKLAGLKSRSFFDNVVLDSSMSLDYLDTVENLNRSPIQKNSQIRSDYSGDFTCLF